MEPSNYPSNWLTNEELELENEKLKKQIEELKVENLHLKLEGAKYLAISCNLRTVHFRKIFYDEELLKPNIDPAEPIISDLTEKLVDSIVMKDDAIKISCHKDPRTRANIVEAEFTYLKPDWYKEGQ